MGKTIRKPKYGKKIKKGLKKLKRRTKKVSKYNY